MGNVASAWQVAKQAEPPPTPAFSRKFASFSSFAVGESNRLAKCSAEMVARNPGQITPLFIYGPSSVGKTHLLEGIWSAERKAGRGATTIYLSAEHFTSQFLEALRGSGMPNFRRKYRGVRVLIFDDLQFLIGKRATQIELINTVNTLLRERRQLVFAANRPPGELGKSMPELMSRLSGGLVCGIEPPEYGTRLGIVEHLSRRLGIELPPDVQRFVASRLTGHARELSGALCCLQATSKATGRRISLPLAEDALAELIRQNMPRRAAGRHPKGRLQSLWAGTPVPPGRGQEPAGQPAADAGHVAGAEAHPGRLERDWRFLRPSQPQHGDFRPKTGR